MQRRFTWESGCWIVREQIPERASQKLRREMSVLELEEGWCEGKGRKGEGRGEEGWAYRIVWS